MFDLITPRTKLVQSKLLHTQMSKSCPSKEFLLPLDSKLLLTKYLKIPTSDDIYITFDTIILWCIKYTSCNVSLYIRGYVIVPKVDHSPKWKFPGSYPRSQSIDLPQTVTFLLHIIMMDLLLKSWSSHIPLNNVNTNQILPSHLLGQKGSTTGYDALSTTTSIDPAPSFPLLSLSLGPCTVSKSSFPRVQRAQGPLG